MEVKNKIRTKLAAVLEISVKGIECFSGDLNMDITQTEAAIEVRIINPSIFICSYPKLFDAPKRGTKKIINRINTLRVEDIN